MPRLPTHLTLLLAETPGPCAVCGSARGAVGFRLYERHGDDGELCHGCAICPACADEHGYHGAVIGALAVEEASALAEATLAVAAGLAPPQRLAGIRAAFARRRALVVADRFTTPPAIAARHFDPAPGIRSVLAGCAAARGMPARR